MANGLQMEKVVGASKKGEVVYFDVKMKGTTLVQEYDEDFMWEKQSKVRKDTSYE